MDRRSFLRLGGVAAAAAAAPSTADAATPLEPLVGVPYRFDPGMYHVLTPAAQAEMRDWLAAHDIDWKSCGHIVLIGAYAVWHSADIELLVAGKLETQRVELRCPFPALACGRLETLEPVA